MQNLSQRVDGFLYKNISYFGPSVLSQPCQVPTGVRVWLAGHRRGRRHRLGQGRWKVAQRKDGFALSALSCVCQLPPGTELCLLGWTLMGIFQVNLTPIPCLGSPGVFCAGCKVISSKQGENKISARLPEMKTSGRVVSFQKSSYPDFLGGLGVCFPFPELGVWWDLQESLCVGTTRSGHDLYNPF